VREARVHAVTLEEGSRCQIALFLINVMHLPLLNECYNEWTSSFGPAGTGKRYEPGC